MGTSSHSANCPSAALSILGPAFLEVSFSGSVDPQQNCTEKALPLALYLVLMHLASASGFLVHEEKLASHLGIAEDTLAVVLDSLCGPLLPLQST